jgi:hypothetical protein
MPKHTVKSEKRAAKQFAAELYTAAASALDAVAAAKAGDGASLDSATEALAFLLEQAHGVLAHLGEPDEGAEAHIAHVAELNDELEWLVPVPQPIVYRDNKAEGYYVEALVWVGDDDVDDEDEDEDDDLDDEDDFTDEDEEEEDEFDADMDFEDDEE